MMKQEEKAKSLDEDDDDDATDSNLLSLLRVSDFCCPRQLRKCAVRVGVVGGDDDDDMAPNQNHNNHQPPTKTTCKFHFQQQKQQHERRPLLDWQKDPDAVAYCSSLALFVRLSVRSGSLVWLCRSCPNGSINIQQFPIVLHLLYFDNNDDDVHIDDDLDGDNMTKKKKTTSTKTATTTTTKKSETTLFKENENDDEEEDDSDNHGLPPVLWVSPLLATSFGFQHWNHSDDKQPYDKCHNDSSSEFIDVKDHIMTDFWIQVDQQDNMEPCPPVALEISLRPLACGGGNGNGAATSSSLLRLPSPQDQPSFQLYPPPPTGRLVTQYGLVSSYCKEKVYFYQVTRIVGEDEPKDTPEYIRSLAQQRQQQPQPNVWVTTSRTRIMWDMSWTGDTVESISWPRIVPRLPPLPLATAYYYNHDHLSKSSTGVVVVVGGGNNDKPNKSSLPPPHPPLQTTAPHPDLRRLLYALDKSMPTTGLPQVLLHVIGTHHDHDVQVAIQAAANMLGRQYVGVFGWAAFAHAHATTTVTNATAAAAAAAATSHNTPHQVSTGGWSDKLAGLQAAFDHVVSNSCFPCLLHLGDVDSELVDDGQDPQLRQDQEARICHVLQSRLFHHNLTNSSSTSYWWPGEYNGTSQEQEGGAYSYTGATTPPLLVVISTQRPLPPGPLLQYLTSSSGSCHPTSIQLSLPDASYSRYLWQQHCYHAGHYDSHSTQVSHLLEVDTSVVDDYLLGRPVHEIVALRATVDRFMSTLPQQQFLHERKVDVMSDCDRRFQNSNNDDNCNKALEFLKEECQRMDRSKRQVAARIPNVSWRDVGGLAQVRQEIMDAIELPLQHPEWFSGSGGRTGILLYGAPGTGKTLVAKAVATEFGLPFLSVKGPELLGSYVGESEANVRATFKAAQEAALNNKPNAASAILFFDELDSLAPRRGGVGDGGGVMDRVVATLLVELDRTTTMSNGRVFCMGATNRPDLLDPSLLRPGRLDRLVYLGLAKSNDERAQVLTAQLRQIRLDPPDISTVAQQVVQKLPASLTNADMASVIRTAVSISLRRLCQQADDELADRRVNGGESNLDLDQVLSAWDPDKLEPTVTISDLLEASKQVAPSVTAEEIANYERLGVNFST